MTDPFDSPQQIEDPFGGFLQANTVHSDTEAALRKASLSDDRQKAFIDSIDKGAERTYAEIKTSADELNTTALADAIESTTIDQQEPVDPEVIQELFNQIQYDNETGPERAWIDQLPNTDTLSSDELEQLKMRRYIQRKISEVAGDLGLVDKIINIGGLMLVPDETYNSVDFVNRVMGTKTTAEGVFNNPEILTKLGEAFSQLEPKEQIVMFEQMRLAAKEVDDNEFQQMILLLAGTGSIGKAEHLFAQRMEQALLAGTVGKVLLGALRGTRILKDLGKVKEYEAVADLAEEATTTARMPSEIGVSRIDAASSSLPTTTGELASVVDQAPVGIATQVRDEWAKMDAIRAEALDIMNVGIKDAMHQEDIALAIERAKNRLVNEQPGIENLSINETDSGVEFVFDVIESRADGRISGILGEKKVVPFTSKDIVTGFSQERVTTMEDILSGVWSPNKIFKGDRPKLVQAFEQIASAQPKVKSKLTDELRVAVKDLNKVSKGNIERVLFLGNKEGKVYSYQELVNSGIGGIKLTDNEYASYAKTRKVLDDLWILKNDEVRTKLEARGAKLVSIHNQKGFSTVFQEPEVALGRYRSDNDFKKVYDPISKSVLREVPSEKVSSMYNNGFVLTKLENTGEFWKLNRSDFKWAFVKKEAVQELPSSVLNYKTGYVPRIYDKAYFFVKSVDRVVDDGGKSHKVMKTQRYFDNETDANTFSQRLIQEKNLSPSDVSVVFNREPIASPELQDDVMNVFGGLFASPRKDEALRFGLDGQEAMLVDPFQAVQQYMFHLGNRIPVSSYKLGIQEKWLQSATDFLGHRPLGGFDEAIAEVKNAKGHDPRAQKFLSKSHEQISTLSSMPTREEQALQGKFVSIGKSIEEFSPKLKGAASFMYGLGQRNPVAATKAATHHMLLGAYSVAQFPVQALGATIAFSINPVYAAKGSSKWLAFSYLDNIKDPILREKQIKALSSKVEGLSDLQESYALWRRSGYKESALLTNGDYASLANGLPYDGNLVKRLFDKGTFFFKAGELANMRISFATSLERWKDLNPGKKLDDVALKEIYARSEQFRLNMGQGNRARFQKGAMSVPLQFQQINTKFYEAITAGSAFSKEERLRLIMGQGLLFGAIGVPFMQQATAYMTDVMDVDTSDVSPEQLNLAKRGLMGWMVNNVLDIDAEVSGRVSIANGATDMLTDMIFEQHDLLGLAGPAGAVTERFFEGPLQSLIMANKTLVKADDLTVTDLGLITENLLMSLAEIPSSTRNAIIAMDLWDTGLVRSGVNGKVLWAEDPKMRDILFQAMGLQSVDKQEYYKLLMSDKTRKDAEKVLVDRMQALYLRQLRALDDGDMEKANAAAKTIGVLGYYADDPVIKNRLTKSLMNRFKTDDKRRELLERVILKYSDTFAPSGQSWSIPRQEAISQ
jgi:hypothetical protein